MRGSRRTLFIQNSIFLLCCYEWKKENFPSQTRRQWEEQIYIADSPLSTDTMSRPVTYTE